MRRACERTRLLDGTTTTTASEDGRRGTGRTTRARREGFLLTVIVGALVLAGGTATSTTTAARWTRAVPKLRFMSDRQFKRRPFWRFNAGRREGAEAIQPPYDARELDETRTFTLFDHCMPEAVLQYGVERDFWNSPRASAKVVKHNHGNPRFFEYDDPKAVELKREEVADGLYAWVARNVRKYDWEFGFAFANEAGRKLYDIGSSEHDAPLAYTECSQKFGKYFNRNVRHERDARNISYVFGTCDRACPSDHEDSTYVPKDLAGLMTLDGPGVDLGPQTDARLIVPLTIMMFATTKNGDTGMNPHLRVATQIDTTFHPTTHTVRWIAGAIDYYRNYLKMIKMEVYIDGTNAFIRLIDAKRHSLAAGQGYDYSVTKSFYDWRVRKTTTGSFHVFCDASRYDLSTIWNDPDNVAMTGYRAQGLQYKSLKIGTSAPLAYAVPGIDGEGGDSLLPDHADGGIRIYGPDGWGPDKDARRVIIKSGVICSNEHNGGACMYGVAQPFDPSGTWSGRTMGSGAQAYTTEPYSGPTKERKQWVLASLVGYGWKLVRIEVFKKDDDSLWIKSIDAGADHTTTAADLNQDTGDPLTFDLSQSFRSLTNGPYPPFRRWGDLCGAACGNRKRSLNMGGVYYDLAGSMVPSLTGIDPVYDPIVST